MSNNRIWWLDTETSGLIPGTNGIIEIACLVQDVETFGQANGKFEQFEALVCPGDVEYSEKALEVNGVTYEEIQTFEPIDVALARMDKKVKYRDIIAGHNVAGFDIPMLKAAYKKAGIKWRWSHHCIDTMVMANFLKFWGLLPAKSLSLQALGEHFGFHEGQFGPAHRALPDVKLTMAVANSMQQIVQCGVGYGF